MKKFLVRPRTFLTAFQWDGEEVEGFIRFSLGEGAEQFVLEVQNQAMTQLAAPGDWVIIGEKGAWLWPPETFEATYEVVGRVE